jgi:hypothetical protein
VYPVYSTEDAWYPHAVVMEVEGNSTFAPCVSRGIWKVIRVVEAPVD